MMLSPVLLITLLGILQLKNEIIYSCNHNASCGCSDKSPLDSKIVGGQKAKPGTWNWVVSLRVRNQFRCAGTILSNLWILTAAHCFDRGNNLDINDLEDNPTDITVHAGSINRLEQSQLRRVSNVIVHPKFDRLNFNNDIALLKLSSPFQMTDINLAKICLPSVSLKKYPPTSSSLVAVGWGRLWENGLEPLILQQVILQAIDYQHSSCYPLIYDQSNQFCAGVENSKKDTCQGDSGGPLMIYTSSKQWVIAGITSFGYGCARQGYSGVYTRVITYLDWLNLFVNTTNNSMYPYSLISKTPFEDDDIEWRMNMSFRQSTSFSMFLLLILIYSLN